MCEFSNLFFLNDLVPEINEWLNIIKLSSHQIFTFKFVFWEGQPPQLPGKFEGSENGILAGQSYQGGGGQGSVSVDSSSGVSETVFTPWLRTILAATAYIMRWGKSSTTVQQNLDDLVVVGVGGQDEGGDVRGEGGGVCWQRLPTLMKKLRRDNLLISFHKLNLYPGLPLLVNAFFMI